MIDNQTTSAEESVSDLFNITFLKTVEELEEYLKISNNSLLWYSFKNTRVRHLLRQEVFSVNKVKIGGNRSIVNAASETHGPSWRMVVELGDGEVNAWGVYPGSQSGNPGNPQYAHMIDDWADGSYHKLLFEPNIDANTEEVHYSVIIQPKN